MRSGDPDAEIFSRFVHWGYWEDPRRAARDGSDFPHAMERLNEQVLRAADLRDGQSVLDAGCGFGGTVDAINRSRERVSLTGVNIDPRQLERAAAAVRARPGNAVRFVEADACALPFPDASFDRVLAVECIFHFPARSRFLAEAARVLRPGGLLALSDFVPLFRGRGSQLGRWLEAKVEQGYGSIGQGFPDGDYPAMARAAGLEPLLDRDITRRTLPTYPPLIARLERMPDPRACRLARATRVLRWLSVLGLLRYRVLSFRKRVAF